MALLTSVKADLATRPDYETRTDRHPLGLNWLDLNPGIVRNRDKVATPPSESCSMVSWRGAFNEFSAPLVATERQPNLELPPGGVR